MARGEFDLWSPTRKDFEFQVKKDEFPKNFQVIIKPKNAEEAKALEKDLRTQGYVRDLGKRGRVCRLGIGIVCRNTLVYSFVRKRNADLAILGLQNDLARIDRRDIAGYDRVLHNARRCLPKRRRQKASERN